jgi:enoyl-CoA hydratase
MSGTVHVTRPRAAIVHLEIDSPPMNALGRAMCAIMLEALDEAESGTEARAVVITGRGAAFCAGADLKEAGRPEGASGTPVGVGGFGRVLARLGAMRLPTIAAVNGHSIGGGFELALACDLRIAATTARFAGAGVNVGLMASTYRLPRLIGVARAKALLLTGLPCDAQQAEQWGLVTALHAPEALADAALDLAARIASRAPLSVEAAKRTIDAAMHLSPEEADQMAAGELAVLTRSQDHREALTAFREKREPRFVRG